MAKKPKRPKHELKQLEAQDNAAARNRARAPLRLRDFAAAAAFASMAISGSLPVWVMGLFAGALLLALFNRRVLQNRGTLTAVMLLFVGAALYSTVAVGRLDLVVAACSLAGLITAQRMLSLPTRRTDAQIHLTSLLMIAGGAALSGEILFAVFLVTYATLATFSLGLSVVEAALPPGEPLPYRPVLRRLGLGMGFAVLGAVAFFILFPRLSWNMAAQRGGAGLGGPAMTGISDRIRLSGDGSIKTNPRIVLRAQLTPDPRSSSLDRYWVGRTFDVFDGHEWVGRGEHEASGPLVALRRGGLGATTLQQRIELLPAYGAPTLVGLDPPFRFSNALARTGNGNQPTTMSVIDGEEVRFDTKAVSYTYRAFSLPEGRQIPDAKRWAQRERYLQLPESLDPRVTALAKQIAGTQTDPLRIARTMERYLKQNYRYTLELAQSSDPLVSFLFERKEGHCEHFATALTVLLRAAGVPARAASGFFGGERMGDQYVVRAGDAHAWAQVLTEDAGFVTFDATPESGRGAQGVAFWSWLATQYEELEAAWRQRVVDYSIMDQFDFVRKVTRPSGSQASDAASSRSDWRPSRRFFAAAALFVLVYFAVTRLRKPSPAKKHKQASRFADDVEALLRRQGIRFLPDDDLESVTARLEQAHHPVAPALRRATRRYLQARFGDKPFAAGEANGLLSTLRRSAPPSQRAA